MENGNGESSLADVFTQEKRSEIMARVRSRDTGPEMIVRHHLHAKGLRYSLRRNDLPGRPDIVFPSRRIAVFVHGCFWHQHPGCRAATLPKTRTDFWRGKLEANVLRDSRVQDELRAAGWLPLVAWECELTPERLDELATLILGAGRE
ncbi:very short patch repair endonuclease [Allorhizobium undicola]|uniref:very short patch repair endonuclease n=1 Tax=Allorhizobium undicola TaxID=78527 RepID=UPI000684FA46|nr:very short patch repair endonuclease [Allorhizobium undicola]